MHPFPFFLAVLHLLVLAAAAPRSATSSATHSSSSANVPSHKPSISQVHHPAPDPTHLSTPVIPHPTQEFTFTPGHTRPAISDAPHPTQNPLQNTQGHSQSGQKPISIVFEVLGGVFASALLLGFIRCFHNYRKTPGRDRIADIVHRHQLQRELEELERNPGLLRRHLSLREPAPPYFPRPPSYENPMLPVSILPRQSHPQPDDRAQYSAVATHSPPSTPPMSERILLPSPAATLRIHPEIP